MKILGIVGGTGPESTIEYYKQIIATYRERHPDGSYPRFFLDNIDLKRMVDAITAGDLGAVCDYLLGALENLARAGADFGLIAANTPHVVFASLAPRSPLPLLSIVEATCDATRARGMKRVGLFGTRFTMSGSFYPEVFSRHGIELCIPAATEQALIHDKYMSELVYGVVRPETHARLVAIVERMRREAGIEGLILGGTELSLILRESHAGGVPLLDTTKIHVEAAVARMLT